MFFKLFGGALWAIILASLDTYREGRNTIAGDAK